MPPSLTSQSQCIWMPALGRKRALAERMKASLAHAFPDPHRNRLLATDSKKGSPIAAVVDHREWAPTTTSDEFISWAAEFCERFRITWIVPTRDAEMLQWSQWKDTQALGSVQILVSEYSLMASWYGKRSASLWMDEMGLPHPGWFHEPADIESLELPILAKPDFGAASTGIRIARSAAERRLLVDSLIEGDGVQPFLEGPEFTINLYFDPGGECRAVIPHERLATREGEVSHGVTVDDSDLLALGEQFARATGGRARGPINFQVIRSRVHDRLFITDINPRFGGGYPLTHKAGGCFTDWICHEFIKEQSIENFAWKAGVEYRRP